MEKQKFVRNKPHLNICVIGAKGHGKTSLTSAMTLWQSKKGYGKYIRRDELDKTPKEEYFGSSIEIKAVEVETSKRHYAIFDCPGHYSAFKNTTRSIAGMDAAILVVDSCSSVMRQTERHLLLARQAGISQIFVVLDNCEKNEDEEDLEWMETKIGIYLKMNDYSEDTPIIRTSTYDYLERNSSWDGSMEEILVYCDEYFKVPIRDNTSPFSMPIINKMSVTGHGTVVTGCVKSGTLKVNDLVEISCFGGSGLYYVKGIETFNKTLTEAQAGDYIGVSLNCYNSDVKRGQVLCTPNTIKTHTQFIANMYVLTKEEGGRHTAFFSGFTSQFYFGATNTTGVIQSSEVEMFIPGDNVDLKIELIRPIAINVGDRFTVVEGNEIIAVGFVEKLLD